MTRAAPQRLHTTQKNSSRRANGRQDCDCGMLFEAYPYKGGELKSWADGVLEDVWNSMVPMISHLALGNDLWYSSDLDFIQQIPGFSSADKYIMRFRGDYHAHISGVYRFS